MARRSKDPAQAALFEFSKPSKRAQRSEVKFTPMKTEIVFMVIGYKKGEERYHQSVPESFLDSHKKHSTSYGYDELKVMGMTDYWEKFNNGGFKVGVAH
jgi:hypothetical protein